MTDLARPPVPNRSAGRIEDELWLPFLAACRAEGITNTEAFRRMIRERLASGPGLAEPVPPGAGQVSRPTRLP